MSDNNGDGFRTARLGGFHKADVLAYIERLGREAQEKSLAIEALGAQKRALLKELLKWRAAAKIQRRRGAMLQEAERALTDFSARLESAKAQTAEIERENNFLRAKIRALEEGPFKEEAPSVPLEQLTFELFLRDLDLDEDVDE